MVEFDGAMMAGCDGAVFTAGTLGRTTQTQHGMNGVAWALVRLDVAWAGPHSAGQVRGASWCWRSMAQTCGTARLAHDAVRLETMQSKQRGGRKGTWVEVGPARPWPIKNKRGGSEKKWALTQGSLRGKFKFGRDLI